MCVLRVEYFDHIQAASHSTDTLSLLITVLQKWENVRSSWGDSEKEKDARASGER
jgi:hypothetical protein